MTQVWSCGRSNSGICNISDKGKQFESTVTKQKYYFEFTFDCKRVTVVYLLKCKVCQKQYVWSAITKCRLRFNQYKSNIKLHREGKCGFKQEKIIENYFEYNHNGT